MGGYARFVVRYPYILILIDLVLALLCGPLTVWKYGIPDFEDPIKGFEARGTQLGGWNNAADLMWKKISDGSLSVAPQGSGSFERRRRDVTPQGPGPFERSRHDLTSLRSDSVNHLMQDVQSHRSRKKRTASKQQFCASLYSGELADIDRMPRMVVKSKNNDTLLQAGHIHGICEIEQEFIYSYWSQHQCDVPSLGLYLAALRGKVCADLTDDDIADVLQDIGDCARYFFTEELTYDCSNSGACPLLPMKCTEYNAVYLILAFLSDVDFMKDNNNTLTKLTYSTIFLPQSLYEDSDSLLTYFTDFLEGENIQNGDVVVPAMNFYISNDIFAIYLFADLPYFALAMGLVVIILLFYLQSFILMITVILNVVFSFCIAYFLYFVVCRMTFFPFINILSALLLIAIGADDVFILYDLWRKQVREEPEASLEEHLSSTLHHGIVSILVTSLTTAAALMANLVSNITAIKCFGIFAGLCVIVTFGLMITWVPAVIVIIEKAKRRCLPDNCCSKLSKCNDKVTSVSMKFWGEIMFKLITKVWPLWIILFTALGVAGLVVILYKPGLSLPSSQEFSFFAPNHPFERYNDYADKFRFELKEDVEELLEMQAVWGLTGEDTGDHLDPDKRGDLVYRDLDVYSPQSQQWLLAFCDSLLTADFVSPLERSGMCYMDLLKELVEGPCTINFQQYQYTYGDYDSGDIDQSNYDYSSSNNSYIEVQVDPCCEQTFPMERDLAEVCIKKYSYLARSGYLPSNTLGRPLFGSNDTLKVFTFEFLTSQEWSGNYSVMESLQNDLHSFMRSSLSTAPGTLGSGWITGRYGYEFRFFDLQKALASGTLSGIGVALLVGCVVLLITSLNILITIYAILTITLIIAITIAVLVLLGWELNIFESLALTLSIGLSVDFTIHYGVAYKLVRGLTRRERIKHVLETVGSAVTMGALTTFVSGASVVPGRVLSYRQFGIFLMLVMTFSWLLSTFFFLALCSVIGPVSYTGDIYQCCKNINKKCRKSKVSDKQSADDDKTKYCYDGPEALNKSDPESDDMTHM